MMGDIYERNTTAIVVYEYPLKCEPQEETAKIPTIFGIQSPSAISNLDQGSHA
jgi:hypothetical protein